MATNIYQKKSLNYRWETLMMRLANFISKIWKGILIECDGDMDGKISLEEFIGLLQSKVL